MLTQILTGALTLTTAKAQVLTFIIFLPDGAACSWRVKVSSTALLSSQEATKDALNRRMLPHHLGFGDPRPTDIYVDNKGVITMGLHPSNEPALPSSKSTCGYVHMF